MFSGIIEELGTLTGVRTAGNGRVFTIQSGLSVAPAGQAGVGSADRERIGLGDSIAINGTCLTVSALAPPHSFEMVAGKETLDCTTAGSLRVGSRVNMERALRLGDRLDGHMVSGHVDGVGRVSQVHTAAESVIIHIDVPAPWGRYVAEKGSICIDGISLTVNEVVGGAACNVRVNIIPYTAGHTVAGSYRPGHRVNLEVDLVARYLERLLRTGSGAAAPGLTPARLAELGFGPPGKQGNTP